jgi:hypothetical protein
VAKIQEELINMINKLPITARFTIFQFASNYKPFSNELVPANPRNKEAAANWIKSDWVFGGGITPGKTNISNPRGIAGIFEKAAEMKPDVIYVVSDGVFSSIKGTFPEPGSTKKIPINYIKQAAAPLKEINCKVNFIIFEAEPEDTRELKQISSMTKGATKEF